MQFRIVCEESDTERDKTICEYLKYFNFSTRPERVIENLLDNPNMTVAEALQMIGFGYWEPNQVNLEAVTDIQYHAFLCRDFSLMICGWSCCHAFPNIFDFIDSKYYEQYHAEHPIHELIWRVKKRFGVEHVMHWAKKGSADSPNILPSAAA